MVRRTFIATAAVVLLFAQTRAVRAAPPNSTVEKRDPKFGFPYGSTKIRGVNLGGWLVLEPWITPSIFERTNNPNVVDEWTFCQFQDYDTAQSTLVKHWNTWITEDDFGKMKAAKLNHVRIPIGYWAYDISRGEPYHQGQVEYLNRAIQWGRNVGIKVIIDLHGAPGSQNGFDNSGHRVPTPLWHTSGDNIARTNTIIKQLASNYSGDVDVVTAIAPLNEPAGFLGNDVLSVIRQYWYDSYGNIRYPYGTSQEGPLVEIIHDAFQGVSYWSDFMPRPNYTGVMVDVHEYQIFSTGEVAMSWDQHISTACSKRSQYASSHLWTVAGEWTLAFTDCSKYLNGRGVGARYDGSYPGSSQIGSCTPWTGNGKTFSDDYKVFLRRFWEAQVTAWETGSGWIYWTWKAENVDEWSYQAGLKFGWIPRDPNQRLYPGICG